MVAQKNSGDAYDSKMVRNRLSEGMRYSKKRPFPKKRNSKKWEPRLRRERERGEIRIISDFSSDSFIHQAFRVILQLRFQTSHASSFRQSYS